MAQTDHDWLLSEMRRLGVPEDVAKAFAQEVSAAIAKRFWDERRHSWQPLPKEVDRLLRLFDQNFGGHGVEVSSFEDDPEKQLFYVNAGDAYNRTLMYRDGRMFLSCLGDEMEST